MFCLAGRWEPRRAKSVLHLYCVVVAPALFLSGGRLVAQAGQIAGWFPDGFRMVSGWFVGHTGPIVGKVSRRYTGPNSARYYFLRFCIALYSIVLYYTPPDCSVFTFSLPPNLAQCMKVRVYSNKRPQLEKLNCRRTKVWAIRF